MKRRKQSWSGKERRISALISGWGVGERKNIGRALVEKVVKGELERGGCTKLAKKEKWGKEAAHMPKRKETLKPWDFREG